jgi:hypothetical protein
MAGPIGWARGTVTMLRSEVLSEGRAVAWGEIDLDPDVPQPEARGRLWVAAGRLPRDARRRIVDEVLDRALHAGTHRLHMTIALGDSETINLLRERCATVQTRSAGSTCLVEAELPRPAARRPRTRRPTAPA